MKESYVHRVQYKAMLELEKAERLARHPLLTEALVLARRTLNQIEIYEASTMKEDAKPKHRGGGMPEADEDTKPGKLTNGHASDG